MRSFGTILPAILAAMLLAGPAAGQENLIDASDPEAVAAIVRGFGSTRMDTAADGTPMIRGRIEGVAFSVYFFQCDDENANCRSILFSAGWRAPGIDIETVNGWNRDNRFGRAYLDDEGDPIVEMTSISSRA